MTNAGTFQARVAPWMLTCFGSEISADTTERNHRFLEEALELVQASGCTQSEAVQLVDYVFARPVGEPGQEVGGVMVTLAALCLAAGIDMHGEAETELARIWTKVEAIRLKQANKPKHSPLPQHAELPAGVVRLVIAARLIAWEDTTPDNLKELQDACELFAGRVPWDDEPRDYEGGEQ